MHYCHLRWSFFVDSVKHMMVLIKQHMLNRCVNNTLHTLWHCVHYKCTYQKYTGCFHQLWGSITSNDVCQLKNDNRVEKHRAPYTESRFTQSSALVLRHVPEKMLAHFAVSTLPVEHARQVLTSNNLNCSDLIYLSDC